MNRLQEKLDFLLEKYSVDVKAVLKDNKIVVIDGMELPILSHRNERRFIELKNIIADIDNFYGKPLSLLFKPFINENILEISTLNVA